ncbi:MAG: DUF429 domain-containing protein, partial [Candidatus Dormibacteraeota bacterium]|nr:DUF429 domain-containing protein [Candidatus Dormibacteraeota bacterium]
MITVGIDLAAQPERTAACRIEWRDGSAEVTALDPRGVTDDRILELVAGADKAGFDVPLGWPDAFVAAVTAHHGAGSWPEAASSQLRLRATDHHVHQSYLRVGDGNTPR